MAGGPAAAGGGEAREREGGEKAQEAQEAQEIILNENKSIQNKNIVDNDSGIIRYENTLPVYNSKKTVEKFTNYNKDEYIGKKELIKRKTSSMIYNNNSMFE